MYLKKIMTNRRERSIVPCKDRSIRWLTVNAVVTARVAIANAAFQSPLCCVISCWLILLLIHLSCAIYCAARGHPCRKCCFIFSDNAHLGLPWSDVRPLALRRRDDQVFFVDAVVPFSFFIADVHSSQSSLVWTRATRLTNMYIRMEIRISF